MMLGIWVGMTRPGILVGMDENDSHAVAAPVFVCSSGTCYAGLLVCSSRCVPFGRRQA